MPSLAILGPHRFSGENQGLVPLHVTGLAQLLAPHSWTVRCTDLLDPDLARRVTEADLVVVQMLASPEVESIARLRRGRGRPTVFEITDNFVAPGDWLAADHPVRSPLIRARLLHHAWLADAVQVYSPGLARMFRRVNPRVIELDPFVDPQDRRPPCEPGFVFGWGGTRSHGSDLAAVAPAVTRFCHRHPDVSFAFMGDHRLFHEHFGGIPAGQAAVRPFGTHDEYLRFVARLDVGLGPLRPTPFNAARSDYRFATYAACGTAAVLQAGPAYDRHRDRAQLFETAAEMEVILDRLRADPGETASLARRAAEWAGRERSAEAMGHQRDVAYRSLFRHQPADAGPPPATDGDRDEARSRLATAGGLDDPAATLAECDEILAEWPAYEQARLLAARCLLRLGRPDEALARRDGCPPSPVHADAFAEVEVATASRADTSRAQAARGRIASPARRARLADHPSALSRSRAVLEHQPFDYFALECTRRWLERAAPGGPELAALLERLALVCPEEVPTDRRPAELAPFLPPPRVPA